MECMEILYNDRFRARVRTARRRTTGPHSLGKSDATVCLGLWRFRRGGVETVVESHFWVCGSRRRGSNDGAVNTAGVVKNGV